jgi:hypothetical protein
MGFSGPLRHFSAVLDYLSPAKFAMMEAPAQIGSESGVKMAKTHQQCTHLNTVKDVTATGDVCPECVAMGDTHAIISSLEPGEDWSWCFIDDIEVVLP